MQVKYFNSFFFLPERKISFLGME